MIIAALIKFDRPMLTEILAMVQGLWHCEVFLARSCKWGSGNYEQHRDRR